MTVIFFGGPSASGNSSDSSTGSQNRRSSSPIGVPAPLSVSNLLSSALSMAFLRGFVLLLSKLGAARRGASTFGSRLMSRTVSHSNGDDQWRLAS